MGAFIGAANGMFGSGGGIVAVPMLEHDKTDVKKAHATSIAITLPLSIISSMVYFTKGSIDIIYALKFIPFGLAGVFLGTKLLMKLSNILLKRIFGVVMIIFGLRLIMR
ncbi:MAG: sulfite exporter TauE/SafE family protein [Ruminococcus sp.]|nr:sulfite exporter TauE/SafE family protein [Ruminococcus sp.]